MKRRVVGELRFWSAPPVQTSDVDEAREVLKAAYLPLEVNPVGRDPLDMRMTAVQLPLLTAGYIHFGGEVKLRAPDVRSYHINIPLSGHAINSWDDGQQQIAAASVSAGIFMPGIPTDSAWSSGCQHICLMIPEQELRRQLETMLDRPVHARLEFERNLDLTATSAASWLELVTILQREADRPDGLLSHPLAAGNLERLLIEGLLLTQPHNHTGALSNGARPASPAVVTRAIDLMRTHPEAPWTTGKLAQKTGVGARALFKAFERSGELPPMTYLRHLRLNRVHSTLLDADPRSVTVTAVASRWGFVHLGRFAAQYYQVFGEYPSTTLGVGRFAQPERREARPTQVGWPSDHVGSRHVGADGGGADRRRTAGIHR
jgi:AraC-like DNA-binding protein